MASVFAEAQIYLLQWYHRSIRWHRTLLGIKSGLPVFKVIIGSLSNDGGDVKEKGKRAIGLD